jgi:predicted MFS family arabinose efflux permease
MSRILAGTLTGGVLGISMSGIIADLVGWRSVLLIIGIMVFISCVAVTIAFRNQGAMHHTPMSIRMLLGKYRIILSHPHARVCYTAVCIETTCVQGVFPYISTFLRDLGQPSLTIAGFVLSGFAVGGLIYSSMIRRLLKITSVQRVMVAGGILVFIALFATGLGLVWQLQFPALVVMGLGFFMTHASIQMFSTEISTDARAIAMSLHSSLVFIGQMIGPIVYGVGLSWLGKMPMLTIAAFGFLSVATACSLLLRHKAEAA